MLMPLQPGTTLGSYSVTAQIGDGGMGDVYCARDTKPDRGVALKLLPEAFTADPDRLARRRQDVPDLRQGDRGDGLRDGVARRDDRGAEDLHAQQKAVHRGNPWLERSWP